MEEKDIDKEIKKNNNFFRIISETYQIQIEALKSKWKARTWLAGGVGFGFGYVSYKLILKLILIFT